MIRNRLIARSLFLLVVFAIAIAPGAAVATTYYVDNSIADCAGTYNPATRSCTGGSYTSYDTIAEAESAMSGGDTVIIRGGTYNERVTIDQSGSGVGSETTFEVYAGETVNMGGSSQSGGFVINASYVKVDGNRTGTSDGLIITNQPGTCGWSNAGIQIDGDYVIVQECNIVECERYGLKTSNDSDHCTISDNYFARNGLCAAEIHGTYNDILRNEVVDGRTEADYGCTSYDADAFRYHGTNLTFAYNYIHGFDYANIYSGDSPHIDAFQTFDGGASDPEGDYCTFEYNYVDFYDVVCSWSQCADDGAHGVFMRAEQDADHIVVRYNLYFGMVFINSSSDDHDWEVYGNTIIGNPGVCSENGRTLGTNCWPTAIQLHHSIGSDIVKNNIMTDFDGTHTNFLDHDGNASLSSDGNITYDADGSDVYCTGTDNGDCKGGLNQYDTDPGLVDIDPTGGMDVRLSAGSNAINSGATIGSSGNQDDGIDPSVALSSWPDSVTILDQDDYGSGWEIGAYLYSGRKMVGVTISGATAK